MSPAYPPRRLGIVHRRLLYAVLVPLWASGLAWVIARFALRPDPTLPGPGEVWWLRLHGLAAMGFLVALGSLVPSHMRHGWRLRLNWRTGIGMVLICAVLVGTGYGLYYLVDDALRGDASLVHWILGLLLGPLAIWHAVSGRRLTRGAASYEHHGRHRSGHHGLGEGRRPAQRPTRAR